MLINKPRLQPFHVLGLFCNRRFKIQVRPKVALFVDLQRCIVQLEINRKYIVNKMK